MLWALSDISGYSVHARDGDLGTVRDMYFDDVDWRVRYLAVSGGGKTGPGKFLLSPEVISRTDREFGLISVFLRTAAVHESPPVAAERFLPRQEESRLRAYYGWPNYWPTLPASEHDMTGQAGDKPHLYSMEEVLGYRLLAGGEDIGFLMDLIVDDHTWQIQSLELDASNWLPAGRAWVRPACIEHVHGARKQIALTIRRNAVMDCPYDGSMLSAAAGEPAPQCDDSTILQAGTSTP